jgi:hypothetical protein
LTALKVRRGKYQLPWYLKYGMELKYSNQVVLPQEVALLSHLLELHCNLYLYNGIVDPTVWKLYWLQIADLDLTKILDSCSRYNEDKLWGYQPMCMHIL